MKRDFLFNTDKIKYVQGEKPDVECILCAVKDNVPDVESLLVYRSDQMIVSLNLYPFNPGHVMIFPVRHLVNLEDMTRDEALEMHELLCKTIVILKEEFRPHGFNVGWNIGQGSGASIQHIHQHIVPRFGNEVGFLEVLSGTKVYVIDPVIVQDTLRKQFNK